MHTPRILLSLGITTWLVSVALPVCAATDTATMSVTLLVEPACAIQTMPSISYAATAGTPSSALAGDLDLLCTAGLPFTISMGPGLHGDYTQRRAHDAASGQYLDYRLLAWNGSEWGDDFNAFAAPAVSASGTGTTQPWSIFLETGTAYVPAGVYTDSVVLTISY